MSYFERLRKRIKYRFSKTYIKVSSFPTSFDSADLSAEQQSCVKIIKLLATDSDSEILMAPISEKYYIRKDEIFIVIDRNIVSVINSVYHYDFSFSDKLHGHLTSFLRRVIENRRVKMEATMRSKIQRSLTHIYDDLCKKYKID
jgi:hypothetical protein